MFFDSSLEANGRKQKILQNTHSKYSLIINILVGEVFNCF